MEFKNLLILNYFKEVGTSYRLEELAELLGMHIQMLDERIQFLLTNEYLTLDEYSFYKVSFGGIEILKYSNMDSFSFFIPENQINIENESNVFLDIHETIEIDEVFIPKDFDKKFKGY